MSQVPSLDGLTLDTLPFVKDGMPTVMIDIGARGHLVGNSFRAGPIFQCLMPVLNCFLRLRMTWGAADVLDVSPAKPFGEIDSDVGWPVIGEQAWLVADMG
jgi:hypothetical protein